MRSCAKGLAPVLLGCALMCRFVSAQGVEHLNGAQVLPGRMLIRLDAEGEGHAARNIENLGFKFVRGLRFARAQIWRIPEGLSVRHAMRIARRMPGVLDVEPDHVLPIAQEPNDPEYCNQYAPPMMSVPQAWHLTVGSETATLAVIDSGVRYDHPDLAGNIYVNPGEDLNGNGIVDQDDYDGLDNDGNGYVDDIRGWDFMNLGVGQPLQDNDPSDNIGHGTMVAGIAGAVGNNATGITGVAWQVRILPLKIAGDLTFALSSNAAVEAIEYATQQGADVINASYIAYGDGAFSRSHLDALQAAQEAGVIVAAAAGNLSKDSRNIDEYPTYPSCYNLANILSVASTDTNDLLVEKIVNGGLVGSAFGKKSVDLGAPGEEICTTVKTGGYGTASGTSFAAPQVAGIAALLRAAFPAMNVRKLRLMIMEGADGLDSLAGRTVTAGRANAYAALTARVPWAKRSAAPAAPPRPIPDNDPAGISETVTITDSRTVRAVSVSVDFEHSRVGDVGLTIQSPAGTVNILKAPREENDETGGSFHYVYDTQWDFQGEATAGAWTLTAWDDRSLDTGSLAGWEIEILVDAPGEDINGDGRVDILDLLSVRNALHGSAGRQDVSGDGVVNVLDLISVRNKLGLCEDQ